MAGLMRAEELFQHLAEVLYVVIFVAVLVPAVQRPSRARVDMALLFGAAAAIVLLSALVAVLHLPVVSVIGNVEGALLMALPYLLLRLVADFMDVSKRLMRGAEAGVLVSLLVVFFVPAPVPTPLTLLLVAYFVGLSLYASLAFLRGSTRSGGVTHRRLQAVALGSVCLGADILVVGLGVAFPAGADVWGVLGPLLGMASGLAYVLGFAPPTWLRRAWQEPEVRAFLGRAATLPHLPDTRTILAELEKGAADATGAAGATIGLWDETSGVLRFVDESAAHHAGGELAPLARAPAAFEPTRDGWQLPVGSPAISARVLREQRALFTENVIGQDPINASAYAAYGATVAVAAPITAGDQRLGVLVVYASRAPIFADSDVELVQLLADQAAVILESRKLLDAAAQAQARTEAARLKEDFLSSAAHDLKTPITGILTQAQVLQRRLDLQTVDARVPTGVARIIAEARRLSALVLELLDVSLLEQGRLLDTRESVNLAELASAVCLRLGRGPVWCHLEGPPALVGSFDPIRIRQLLEHLVDNAVKFSPPGHDVLVKLWQDDDDARVDVVDHGIGIPPDDVPRLFQRFHRGSNVDDRRFAGLGLGLYISHAIAEQHGGNIWLTSTPRGGSTLSVRLPLQSASAASPPAALAQGARAGG